MATVIAHPAGIPEGEIDSIKENLVKHFQTKVTSLKSLYLQLW